MKAKFITVSLASFFALLAVWGVLVLSDLVQDHFATKQNPAYETLPFEFRLKADAKNVIYSEAYTTSEGKDIVKYAYVTGEAGPQPNEDLERRTPNSYTEVIEKFEDRKGKPMEKLKTTFLSRPQFYEKEGKWQQIEYATTTPGIFSMSGAIPHIKRRELVERLVPGSPVFATVSTFYPDPNVEASSVDGEVGEVDNTTWASAHDSLSGSQVADSATTVTPYVNYYLIDTCPPDFCLEDRFTIKRGFFLFDTSALPDTAFISTATVSLHVTSVDDNLSTSLRLVSSTPASNTSLAVADYDAIGTTALATDKTLSSITTGAYNTYTLNSTGISNISLSGVSKFGARVTLDADDTAPGFTVGNGVTIKSAETSLTTQDPKLEVTYTTESFSFGMWFPF